ncbi:glycosyltransferase family 9 protein [Desulfonatronum sp. SC1]|uniref:glycosyltransferase family 9 protein n=1 Tax=Desulfonatronum sp. SC1 TaxID=2109626 RepID=UPI000D30C218|nr:glycosyltransferase family 9 protein [Desulfonatronum sp. SC1]PTN38322.1 glycosyltransferase family 9 protein [Desulfonatronum sp. SC1]
MRTLVMNLTRFGDLLQTQPVIAGLRDQGRSAALICLDNFAGATQFLPDAEEVFALPGAGLLADLDRSWPTALERLAAWKRTVVGDHSASPLLNLTPVQSARLLARVLTTAPVSGFGLDDQGFGYYGNAWAAFLQTSTMNRGCSPFNLVDLMLRGADLPISGRDLELARPDQDVLDHLQAMLEGAASTTAASSRRGYVALQLGASEPRRQWPEEYFAQLGGLLWERFGLCPVLLGTAAERRLVDGYAAKTSAPFIDLTGRTSLPELAAALCHADLLVTNDTGTMHLAAGLGRPVAAIFLATAQPWDTGPYQENSLCLEPNLDCHPCAFGTTCDRQEECRHAITPEQAFELIRAHLLPQSDEDQPATAHPKSVRAWKTCRDAHVFLDLTALTGQETDPRTQWIRIQRHYYRQFLDQQSDIRPPDHLVSLPSEARAQILASLEQAVAMLRILESQAQVLATAPLPKIKQKFMAYWERLQAHWQADPFFAVLGRLWLTESQDQGRDIAQILRLTRRYLTLTLAWKDAFDRQ